MEGMGVATTHRESFGGNERESLIADDDEQFEVDDGGGNGEVRQKVKALLCSSSPLRCSLAKHTRA